MTAGKAKTLRLRTLLAIAGVVALFMTLYGACLNPHYATSDDVFMDLIASGMGSSPPDNHIVCSTFLIGTMLSSLYRLAPGIAWYPIYLIAVQFVAHVLICSILWSVYRSRLAALPIALYLVSVAGPILCTLQFSTTAAILGIAGGALTLTGIESRVPKVRITAMLCGLFLCAAASNIRVFIGLVVSIVFAAVSILKYFGRDRGKLLLSFLSIGIMLTVVTSARLLDNAYYRSTGMGEFVSFRNTFPLIFDWGRGNFPDYERGFAAAGWTQIDYSMLKHGLLFDARTLNAESIEKYCAQYPPYRGDWIVAAPRAIFVVWQDPLIWFLVILVVAGVYAVDQRKFPRGRLGMLIFAIFSMAVCIAGIFKFNRHVCLPLLFSLLLVVLAHLDTQRLRKLFTDSSKYPLMAGMALLLVSVYALQVVTWINNQRSFEVRARNFLPTIAYLKSQPGKLIFLPHISGVVQQRIISPFATVKLFDGLDYISSLTSRMSQGKSILHRHGHKDFALAVLAPDSLLWSETKSNRLLAQYFKERFGKRVEFKKEFESGSGGLGVYRALVVQ